MSLTGVATMISGLDLRVAAWTCSERPPTTSAARTSVNCASFWTMLCTCRSAAACELVPTGWINRVQAIRPRAMAHLDCQLPGGREDEGVGGGHPARAEQQPLQDRQSKCCRLARPCIQECTWHSVTAASFAAQDGSEVAHTHLLLRYRRCHGPSKQGECMQPAQQYPGDYKAGL